MSVYGTQADVQQLSGFLLPEPVGRLCVQVILSLCNFLTGEEDNVVDPEIGITDDEKTDELEDCV